MNSRFLLGWIILSQLLFQAAAGELRLRFSFRSETSLDQEASTNVNEWKSQPSGAKTRIMRSDLLLSNIQLHNNEIREEWSPKEPVFAYLSLQTDRAGAGSASADDHDIVLNIPEADYDSIQFQVGLSSAINHGDPSVYPAGHPLNPNLNGLHWNWQGGYVFWALEGYYQVPGETPDDAEQSAFSFHFAKDENAVLVNIPLEKTFSVAADGEAPQIIEIVVDPNRLLDRIPWKTGGMSTHSREGDPVLDPLKYGIQRAFTAVISDNPSTRKHSVQDEAALQNSVKTQQVRIGSQVTPYRFVVPKGFSIPEFPSDNPLTEEGVALGERLFFEKRLSKNSSINCASCHQPENGFVDAGKAMSLGDEGQKGTRNSMTLINLAWKSKFFWDGRAGSLREQVLGPIQNPLEMNANLNEVVKALQSDPTYPAEFDNAFGDRVIDSDLIARALEQYLLTLTASNSKLDQAMAGKTTLSELERRGFELFFTERDPRRNLWGADCFHCHGGPLFTNHGFFNTGLDAVPGDAGLQEVTGSVNDQGKFATPTLRNIGKSAPYMHDGRFETLEEVLDFYSESIHPAANLDPNLAKHRGKGLGLSQEDKKALLAFLSTLNEP